RAAGAPRRGDLERPRRALLAPTVLPAHHGRSAPPCPGPRARDEGVAGYRRPRRTGDVLVRRDDAPGGLDSRRHHVRGGRGAPIGNEVLYVDRADSPHALRWQLGVGSRVPAYCSAMGKAILASMAPADAARRLPRHLEPHTSHTITKRASLLAHLAETRVRGYALDDEEFMDGVRCVAVAVGHEVGGVAHALSLAGPAFRMSIERAKAFVQPMRQAASRIDELLAAEGLRRSPGA